MPKYFVTLPVIPTKEMLKTLVVEKYPEDHEAGKEAQRCLGLDIIPPNAEMEIAYGKYGRMIKPFIEMDFAELGRRVLVDLINQLTYEQKGKLKRLFGSINPYEMDVDELRLSEVINLVDRTLILNMKKEDKG